MPGNKRPAAPYAGLPITKYIDWKIAASSKTADEIAKETVNGRTRDIEAIRKGKEKFPIERIYLFAQSLTVAPGHLIRLAFESYYPDLTEDLAMLFGFHIATPCEEGILRKWREATDNKDPLPTQTRERVEVINRMMEEVRAVMAPR
jgi:hypothetical protein